MSRLGRAVRSPALHFLVLGGLLFAFWPGDEDARPLLPHDATDEEVLFRVALDRGLHERDPLVRRRLVRNMRFVADERAAADPAESDEVLLERAYELGMHETDLVVRRRLVQRLRLAAASTARASEPGEDELRAHLAAHAATWERPERVRLTQVFLSRDRRGDALPADAAAALGALRAGEDVAGDPLLLPRNLPLQDRVALAGSFGPAFADAVLALPDDAGWQGPVESAYGLHLVRVLEREPSRPARLEEVEIAVRESLLGQRSDRELERRLAIWRARLTRPLPESENARDVVPPPLERTQP